MSAPPAAGAGLLRAPLAFSAVVLAAALAVLPWAARPAAVHPGFFPAVIAIVACFDLLSGYLLLSEFHSDGNPRLLAMACAYTCSLVPMIGCAGAFPGLVSAHPPWATAPSVAPWLYVVWHTTFPVLLGVSWAPWPRRFADHRSPAHRTRTIGVSVALCVGVSAALVALLVHDGPRLPVVIRGENIHRLTSLSAPVSLPLVLLSALVTTRALRRSAGPERWTAAAVWVCLIDLFLTYASERRFSTGWYAGRTLTVLGAGVVLLAMLREAGRLRTALLDTLERETQAAAERDNRDLMLRAVIANSQSLIYVKDLEGRYLLANEAFERAFATTAAQLVGRDDRAFDPALAPIWRANDVRAQQEELHADEWVDGPDGRRFFESVKFPLHNAEGVLYGTCGVSLDVTERRLAAGQMAVARDEALAAAAGKSAFLATMSHEIRTPMNAVIGMTDLLLDTPLDGEQREFTETVRDSGNALLDIINDILDFSKIESGELELDEHPFELRDCVESALALVAAAAAPKDLELVADIDSGCPPLVLGDQIRFRQVIVNLLSNAVKFTERGEVVVSVRSEQLTAAPDGPLRVMVSVSDTGIGIPTDRRHRLFQAFSQVDSSTTRVYGGTGLGLAISRRLAQAMDGDLAVVSEPGVGSTFTFSATLRTSTDRRGPEPAPAVGSLTGKTVLIVDDNATNRRVLHLLLESWGMVCTQLAAPSEVLELLGIGRSFDVAVLDMHMPGMDGQQLASALRELPAGRDLPLVLLTSLQWRLEVAHRDLFTAQLTKPARSSVLREKLLAAVAPAEAVLRSLETADGRRSGDGPAVVDGRPLVLLAEDNAVNQKVAQLMLDKIGYRVEIVGNGQEAIEAVRRVDYYAVLMDLQMPQVDGLEATRRIRVELPADRQPPIIAVSASVLPEDRAACSEAGMDAYLSKPIRTHELSHALAQMVLGRPAHQPG